MDDVIDVQVDVADGVTPDVWLVWDGIDYYGPDLVGVFATRDAAVQCVRDIVTAPSGANDLRVGSRTTREFSVEGVAWGRY